MELDTLPEHLFIIGSGYIGLEFAQMFRRYTALKEDIFTHPTLAEGLNTLFMTLDS